MSKTSNSDTNRRKLLYIVTWNIGGLDFMVAVLWKLRTQYPNVDITVFFAEPHYDHVLRGGRFFLDLFTTLGIEYKDFRDLLPSSSQSLLKMFDPILAMSPLDYTTPKWIQRLQHFFNRRILNGERFAQFLDSFAPDCIIIDDRKYYLRPFCGYTELETYYNSHSHIPIIQIPHAIKSEYYGDLFPNRRLCEVWLPLVAEQESMIAVHDLEHVYQTFVPSLDDEWLEFAKQQHNIDLTSDSNIVNCIVLLEPFERMRDLHYKQNIKFNPKQFSYEQMKSYLHTLHDIQQIETKKSLYFWIKPHPKQDSKILKKILTEINLKNYRIIWDTNHGLMNMDMCLSMLTTAVYPFLVSRIPTIMIITHRIKVMPLPELYKNLTYSCQTPEETLNALIEILTTGHRNIEGDYQHTRSYLPDHALDVVMERLKIHLRLDNLEILV